MRRASLVVFSMWAMIGLVLAGCSSRPKEAAPAANADLAAEQSVRLNLGGEPATLDPARASFATEITIIDQLFRGTLKFDANLKLVPDLAVEVPSREDKSSSEEGLTYTVRLKPGLTWSDGPPPSAPRLGAPHSLTTLARSYAPPQQFARLGEHGSRAAQWRELCSPRSPWRSCCAR